MFICFLFSFALFILFYLIEEFLGGTELQYTIK